MPGATGRRPYDATVRTRSLASPTLASLLVASFAACLLAVLAPAASAVTAPLAEAAGAVNETGSFVEPGFGADEDLRAAIAEANAQAIGVVLLAGDVDAPQFARQVTDRLQSAGSRYRTVLVVSRTGVGGGSFGGIENMDELVGPGSAAFRDFNRGATAQGIRRFTQAVSGTGEEAPAATSEADGGGFPWIALFLVIGLAGVGAGVFLLVRDRQRRRRAESDLEARRAEIGEQLRDNADRVITLGEAAVSSGQSELIDLYEQASGTYRDISHDLPTASTRDALDRLDERLDEAEWKLQVVEARLAGRPAPPRPPSPPPSGRPGEGGPGPASPAAPPPPPSDRPALGPDESLFGQGRPPGPPQG